MSGAVYSAELTIGGKAEPLRGSSGVTLFSKDDAKLALLAALEKMELLQDP